MRILFMGPPGSGKGTQCKRLAQALGLKHLSSGDILREAIRAGTPFGEQVRAHVEGGNLVPDPLMIGLIEERFRIKGPGKRGFIADGYPRTLPQAKALDEILVKWRTPLDAVVLLQCPDALIVDRITGRRSCVKCGTPFHVNHRPPKKPGFCDACGGQLVQREDDTEEKVRRRLEKYHAETEAVIPFYEEKSIVKRVDSSYPPEDVYRAVEAALRNV